METLTAYPAIRYADGWATAYPRVTSPDTDWLGSVAMPRDTAANRARAERELRKMFPAPAPIAPAIEAQRTPLAATARPDFMAHYGSARLVADRTA